MRLMGAKGTSGACHTAEMNKAPSRCVVAAALCCVVAVIILVGS